MSCENCKPAYRIYWNRCPPYCLRGQDLGSADLLGADLRDADLRGARLTDALFLAQTQVNSARGDEATELPAGLTRPSHWT